MKTAGRENPNRWARAPRNRAHGAAGQNRSRSIKWAAKQEKFQPQEMCFFLTSTFIERFRKNGRIRVASGRPKLPVVCARWGWPRISTRRKSGTIHYRAVL